MSPSVLDAVLPIMEELDTESTLEELIHTLASGKALGSDGIPSLPPTPLPPRHIQKPEDSSPKRDWNPHNSKWWQARTADVLTVSPRVAIFSFSSRE